MSWRLSFGVNELGCVIVLMGWIQIGTWMFDDFSLCFCMCFMLRWQYLRTSR